MTRFVLTIVCLAIMAAVVLAGFMFEPAESAPLHVPASLTAFLPSSPSSGL